MHSLVLNDLAVYEVVLTSYVRLGLVKQPSGADYPLVNGSEHLSKPIVLPSNLRLGRRRNTIAQANTLRRFTTVITPRPPCVAVSLAKRGEL